MNKKIYLLLGLIFVLGAFLRFFQLTNFPVGLHRDEAFLGYNAYSILKTGKDMTGHLFPLHLESFLYSPAGYSYFAIPFIVLFGLGEFSVRSVSAFFGSLTIVSTFFLTQTLFASSKKRDVIALFSSLLLAITPWHINLSRASAENVLVVFFVSIGVWLFLLWVKTNKIPFFIFSFLSFFITLFLYQAPRAFLPMFLPFLFLLFLEKAYKKWIVSIFFFVLLIVVPTVFIITSPTLSLRIRMLSIFQEPGTQLVLNEQLREDGVAHISPKIARIFNNKVIDYSSVFLTNYFKHFSYDFLFTENALPIRYQIPAVGLLYPFEIILFLFGFWGLAHKENKSGIFLLGWILLAPIGSAITFDDVPNLQRTLIMFPALPIVFSFGLVEFFFLIAKIKIQKSRVVPVATGFLVLAIFTYSLSYYLEQYYLHAPLHKPWNRQVGYKELVQTVTPKAQLFKSVVVTKAESAPAIFFLFFNSYNPRKFQNQLVNARSAIKNNDFGEIPFDNFIFTDADCPLKEDPVFNYVTGKTEYVVKGEEGVLYVDAGFCNTPRVHAKLIKTIFRPDNTPVFKVLTYTP